MPDATCLVQNQRVQDSMVSMSHTALFDLQANIVAFAGCQDAQSEEVSGHFSQYGPVSACQLAHNNSALIALVERQSNLQVTD